MPKVLILDDEVLNVRLLEKLLEGEAETLGLTDPREVEEALERFQPDLVFLDLMMPHLDGYQVLRLIRERVPGFLPVVVLTADVSREARLRALDLGATDFLTKPLDPLEVRLRARNLLEMRALHQALARQNEVLEARVRERTQDLLLAQEEVLWRLARAAEYRDDETGEHVKRVAEWARRLAEALGLDPGFTERLHKTAPLHDLGKIGIPDAILRKPGPLTPEEYEVVKTHTLIGARLLAGGRSPLTQMAERIARSHHERWDGTGYPDGLKGEAIPLEARIVGVVDVMDALLSERPYKPPWPLAKVLDEIRAQRGRQFDPQVVDALLALHA
ncbi:two-component system response regulator [Thermus sp. FJN-A]